MKEEEKVPRDPSRREGAKPIPLLITVLVGVVLWFLPAPEYVSPKAMHLLAIFVATIVGVILKPLPMGAVAMAGIAATAVTGTLSIDQALSGFGNRVIWLVVVAFFIARGFIKTGLGARIAYLFMVLLGKKTLGLAYGMVATDLVLSPAIPSNTARAGGVILPLQKAVAESYGSRTGDGTAGRIGSFLIMVSYQGTVITSTMFLTAMAANPLAASLASQQGVDITWGTWALAGVVPGLASLLVVPFILYKVYPPEIRETPAAAQTAREKLAEMGPMKRGEWVMLVTLVLLILLWIFGRMMDLHSTAVAMIGLGLLILLGSLSWDDILGEKEAWNTLVWFAALVMMASYLNTLGLTSWFGHHAGDFVREYGWVKAFLVLSLIYFYSHYAFASSTAHISSMYAPFLVVSITLGTPPMLAALVLAFFSNLCSSLTHYGTGAAPVLFGSGYVPVGAWWRLGLLISVVNIVIWFGLGGLWWKLIGLW